MKLSEEERARFKDIEARLKDIKRPLHVDVAFLLDLVDRLTAAEPALFQKRSNPTQPGAR